MTIFAYPGSEEPIFMFETSADLWALFCARTTPPAVRVSMLYMLKDGMGDLKEKENRGQGNPYEDWTKLFLTIAKEAFERDKSGSLNMLVEHKVWQTALRFALQTAFFDVTDNYQQERGVQAQTWSDVMEILADPWLYSDAPGFGLHQPLSLDIKRALESGYARSWSKFKSFPDIENNWNAAAVLSGNPELFLNDGVNYSAIDCLLAWLRQHMQQETGEKDLGPMQVVHAIKRVHFAYRKDPREERNESRVNILTRLLIESRKEHLLEEELQSF